MTALDPRRLFRRLAGEIPRALRKHVLIVGSLAAAYPFRARLERRAVNTKDADVVVHPAGDVGSSGALARKLLALGWTRTPECYPMPRPSPSASLRAVRLYPPGSRDYFIELLGLPGRAQSKPLVWNPVRLPDGWYGVGSHRFMGLAARGRRESPEGLDHASPAMMALSNLLSHPRMGPERMSAPVEGLRLRRSAKDLGRVLALAWLAGREETARWTAEWEAGLRACFPRRWRALARGAGSGLRELLGDGPALEEARITTEVGLLSGRRVTVQGLRATGLRLLADALVPLAQAARRNPTNRR